MVQQINQMHLDFLTDARNAFNNDPSLYTYRNGTHDDDDTLIALRYGMDRDCVLIYELGECVANFVQQMVPAPIPRQSVMKFAHDMEKLLKANDNKGGWTKEHHQDLRMGLLRNHDELSSELFKVPEKRNRYKITALCADIANYAMMIADNKGDHL